MKVAILTSDSRRHFYFARRLMAAFNVVGVFAEAKSYRPETVHKTADDRIVLEEWFALRDAAEEHFFGTAAAEFGALAGDRAIPVAPGAINNAVVVEKMRVLAPDVVAVFGSSLVKAELLAATQRPFVNMHLGLSPYYRGSGTNFWPFYNGELEYVGVTIHHLDLGIDSGDIIHQGRPQIELGDNPHTIGCKTIVVGTDLMIRTLPEVRAGTARGVKQEKERGRLFRRKDFEAEHVRQVRQRLCDGLIENYARNPVAVNIVS